VLFALWAIQFALSPVPLSAPFWGAVAGHIHRFVTYAYLILAGAEIVRLLLGRRKPLALALFAEMWRRHVRR
jgi:hypothetical protein